MDFAALVIFLILYYIRPHEWIGVIAALKPVKWSIFFALITMFLRDRGFNPRDLIRTPHDWLMLLYFAWIVLSNAAPIDTFFESYNYFVFYIVTVQALSNPKRSQGFLSWWTLMIMIVAGLAVASEYGFDLVDSKSLTHGRMKERLVLNMSIYNNPNALGHTAYPAVFLLYFLLFWKRPVFVKIATLPLMILPIYCVYLTQSKGSFLGAFVTLVAALTFGRPKVVQMLVLIASMTLGWTLLWSMPRMEELNRSSTDQAIQGRVTAFRWGLHILKTDTRGVGINQFIYGLERAVGFKKAAHCSYVQVGAELGWPGLFLFVGILYCCLRSLWVAKTTDPTEERVRRGLFVLLVSYCVSSWMVNWPFRSSFFLMIGAIAAFHRLMLAKQAPVQTETEPQAELISAPAIVGLQTAPALPTDASLTFNQVALPTPAEPEKNPLSQEFSETTPAGLRWNRLNWVDLLMMVVLTWVTVQLWKYLITKM